MGLRKNHLVKKIEPIVDNLTEAEQKRLKLIQQIQEIHQNKASIKEITRRFQIDRRTTKKYLEGDPMVLCRSNKRSNLDPHKNFIIRCLNEGKTQSGTTRLVMEMGCGCGMANVRQYVHSVVIQYQLAVNKYVSSVRNGPQKHTSKPDYITRKGIFQYLWLDGKLTQEHYKYLWGKYKILSITEQCIREFREIFRTKRMPLLYLFIDKYKDSEVKEIASFVKGLEKDIAAVENAVASDLSNGFVEGTNNKVKMVKRTMYGRCSQKLLSAKLMYTPT